MKILITPNYCDNISIGLLLVYNKMIEATAIILTKK